MDSKPLDTTGQPWHIMRIVIVSCLAVGATVTAAVQPDPSAPAAQAAARGQRTVVPFSEPGRLGTVRVRVIQGSVSVRAGSGRDVTVEVAGDVTPRLDRGPERRPDGLRRLTQPAGLDIAEEGNVVSITARPSDGRVLAIEVPTRTNLELSVVTGNISVEGVEGEIEVNDVNGDVTLTDVAGTVVAHSVNGGLRATMRQVADAPMAFTSLNGEVDVTLPASTKGTFRLRSDQGDVYTDFDLQTMAPPAGGPDTSFGPRRRAGSDRDRRQGAARERQRQRAQAQTREKDGGRYALPMDRSVYGTINGGGAEIELRTYNGDVFLRKGK